VKRELLEVGVQLEDYGGEVQSVEISALKGEGLEALEEALLMQADLCQIKGAPKGPVQGVVIESRVDKKTG
jgi:translation initiation factor IF-2